MGENDWWWGMKVTLPKDSAEEARIYLQAWLDLHEGPGVAWTQKMILILQVISWIAGLLLLAGIFLAWHPIAVALAGIAMGFSGAEIAGLRSRMRAWPHNEEFIDWDRVRESLGASDQEAG